MRQRIEFKLDQQSILRQLRSYTWGLDKEGVRPGAGGVGGLLQVTDHATSKTYYALNDYLGNVIGLVDGANGEVAAAYEFDPFGRELRATGDYAAANPFRFSSQYTDSESGLVYFGFRYYHPEWGRFLNRDPIEEAGGENLYRFVSNDPVNRWDLLGLEPKASLTLTNHGTVSFSITQGTHAGATYAGNRVTFNSIIEGIKPNDIIVSQFINSSTYVFEDGSVHVIVENVPDGGRDGSGQWYNGAEGSNWVGGYALATDENGKPVGLSPEIVRIAEEPSASSITFHDGPGLVYKPEQIPITKTGSYTTTISQASTGQNLAEVNWRSSTSVDRDGNATTEFSVNQPDASSQISTENEKRD